MGYLSRRRAELALSFQQTFGYGTRRLPGPIQKFVDEQMKKLLPTMRNTGYKHDAAGRKRKQKSNLPKETAAVDASRALPYVYTDAKPFTFRAGSKSVTLKKGIEFAMIVQAGTVTFEGAGVTGNIKQTIQHSLVVRSKRKKD